MADEKKQEEVEKVAGGEGAMPFYVLCNTCKFKKVFYTRQEAEEAAIIHQEANESHDVHFGDSHGLIF